MQKYGKNIRFHHKNCFFYLSAQKYLAFRLLIRNFATQMTKTLYNKYDKRQIANLPRVLFGGRIVVVLNEHEAEKAVNYLLDQHILGVDTETRPSFTKGHTNRVSLLQVASHDVCFLFRLNNLGLSPAVRKLLEDTSVPKIGLSWHDDRNMLHRLGDFSDGGCFIDLQDHVKEIGVEDMSLQKLYANFFGMKISKREQLTNWEADILSDKQKLYAATDAWACIMLYEELLRLKESNDYELIKIVEHVQSDTTPQG
jgi:ribonuclease D